VLDHVSLPVSDLEWSKRFYEETLSPLGYKLVMEHHISGTGFGQSGKPDFWIRQGAPGTAVHVAFASDNCTTVDAFHEGAIAAGATTVVPGFAPSTIRLTTGPSFSIQTTTTSKWSAMGQDRKPKPSAPYSPKLVEGELSEIGIQHHT
jgi:catechol 2,3-dioxygenase-like lactoylglutathione lyase family enzyme